MAEATGGTSAGVSRRWRRGGLVTSATVLTLAAGLGLTVLGLGSPDRAVASFDAASWVWSRSRGELARINGVTARVDTRADVAAARGHALQVSQNDRVVLMRDLSTGVVSSMDLSTLQVFARTPTTAGVGVSVALQGDAAFVVDAVQGVVRQLDPRALTPVGEALHYPPGITGGTFDGRGRLWIAVPSQGTVSAVQPARTPATAAAGTGAALDGGAGGTGPDGAAAGGAVPDGAAAGGAAPGGGSPRPVETVTVAPPSHDLAVSALDDGVAVLDRTTNVLSTVRGGRGSTVELPLDGPGVLAARTGGAVVPVTVPATRRVFVAGGAVRDFAVPGSGPGLQPAVAWQGYFYVADDAAARVRVFDAAGRPAPDIVFAGGTGGPLELDVREGYLFVNAPGAATARVVDGEHRVRVVDKYADGVLGGDPPPNPPPPPPKPRKPAVTPPGPPAAVRAVAGNAQARVTWRAAPSGGTPVLRYVVEGAGRTVTVGAQQRALAVTGLTNGETYRFSVRAVNAKGAGPPRMSNPVRPTSEVPDAPTAATAVARPDGTVLVSWPAANGQGLAVRRYQVTAVSAGVSAPAGEATGTSLTVGAGELEYGRQYAFTVIAVNERGTGSVASPTSNTVVPFTRPDRPDGLDAATVGTRAGAVRVTWNAPQDNGRPITGYRVGAGGTVREVTGATTVELDGFGEGQTVQVQVQAVNEAGPGEPAVATARTVSRPQVTVTGSSATFNTATVTFSVAAGGGTATCRVAASGGATAAGSCASLRVRGLRPSTDYTLTVSARNAAGTGTATRRQRTAPLYGTATCINGQSGDTAHYCDADVDGRNGNEIFEVTRQDDDRQAGWVPNGHRLQAYCKKSGENVDSYIYNDRKKSSWWIQVNYKGRTYIPWAWLNLDGGDELGDLPAC